VIDLQSAAAVFQRTEKTTRSPSTQPTASCFVPTQCWPRRLMYVPFSAPVSAFRLSIASVDSN
jgi:hypothetical protein